MSYHFEMNSFGGYRYDRHKRYPIWPPASNIQ
jgi:hypothetical protein